MAHCICDVVESIDFVLKEGHLNRTNNGPGRRCACQRLDIIVPAEPTIPSEKLLVNNEIYINIIQNVPAEVLPF